LEGSWLVAAWGQGTLASASLPAEMAQFQDAIKAEPMAGLGIWAIYHLSEFGLAARVADDGIHGLLRVRTLWANPDELVSAVEEKIAAFAAGDAKAVAAIDDLAKKHPGTPFARDAESGAGGLMAPVALTGVLAAVSIPAFMKYMKKSKTSEARELLRRMYDGARAYWMEQTGSPRLPAPSAGPTPPLGTCCQQGGKCQPDLALWAGEPWRSLKFSMDDPHYYSYEYKVAPDGKGFTVRAYGDLDCDGQYSTFSLYGEVNEANADGPPGTAELQRVDETE
ncbi:MAG TPA: hypothetical protein VFU21_20155, partial [Kofleriaceae bacterium]|nr:hypothetical protein [Kofleriaceae bacterium]